MNHIESEWTAKWLGGSLVLWHRVDRGITLSGSNVSLIDDRSGRGLHTPQATVGMRPLYMPTGGVGGRPIIRFDGLTQNLYNAAWGITINQPYAIFLCCKQYATVSGTKYVLTGANYVSPAFYRSYVPGPYYVDATTSTLTAQDPTTSWHVVGCLFNGANSQISLNDGVRETISPGANAINGLCIAEAGSSSGFATQLDFTEVVVMQGIPSDHQWSNVVFGMRRFAGF